MDRKILNDELGRITPEEFRKIPKLPVILILDNIRSLNNIGSVFRTADSFTLEAVYLCGITARPPHRDIHKTALGATETVEWKYFPSTIEAVDFLRRKDYRIYSIEQTEKSISLDEFKIDPSRKYALVFGNEVMGVEQEVVNLSDGVIEIPQTGTKHSLNIAVSAGIVVWQFFADLKKRN